MISRANIILTHNCNLRCKHCYIDAKYCKENYDEIFNNTRKLLEKLKDTSIKNVMFTGGECMIFSYLKDLIEYAKELGLIVTIFTNGMLFKKEIFDLVDYVNISLDGPKNIHNLIRQNENSYDNVMKVLDYLKQIDKKTTIQVTINKLNVSMMDFLSDLTLNHLNVRTVKLVFVSNDGRASKNNIYHDERDIDYIYSKLDWLYEKSKYHIQFVPNVVNKYDFENYYLSGNLSFPLWFDIPNEKYYVLQEGLLKNHVLSDFNLNMADEESNILIKKLYEYKNMIEKNKYINVEDELFKICRGNKNAR